MLTFKSIVLIVCFSLLGELFVPQVDFHPFHGVLEAWELAIVSLETDCVLWDHSAWFERLSG